MARLSTRRVVWGSVAILSVVVLSGSAYVFTRPEYKLPVPPPRHIGEHNLAQYTPSGEEQRAKALPEYAELKKLAAKENRPFSTATVNRLGELTTHSNYWIRLTSVSYLGGATAPDRTRAIEFVGPALKDENPHVHVSAIHALGALKAMEYVPALQALLVSPDSNDRSCARHALESIRRNAN